MLTINTSGSASRTGDYGTSGTGGRNEKAERAGNVRASMGLVG
jgi:hypothetical protein